MSLPTLLGSPGTSGTIQTTIGTINVTANQNLSQVAGNNVLAASNGQQVISLADSSGANKAFINTGGQLATRTGLAGGWAGASVPTTATQASITQASAGVGKKNVCTGFSVQLINDGTATAEPPISWALLDGVGGGASTLMAGRLALTSTANLVVGLTMGGLWIENINANTSMTLKFNAAGGSHTYETASMTGVTSQD